MPVTVCPHCAEPLADLLGPCATCGLEPTLPIVDSRATSELARLRAALMGDYDIAGELGRGGMATVYLAHDLTLDRKVAIKVMSQAVLHGGGSERFRREARTAAALSHPNIIPIYAVKQVDDLLFFVMKFVNGRPLDAIIAEVGPLPIPMVQAVLAQVAGALGYAHRQGVVHRDVKPANIIIDDEGWAVVTDFGIARVGDATGLTTAGSTVGTPNYMSPEQCLADPEITGAADQYALGVLAYEMLTGATPFAGKTTLAMMYSHVHDAPTPLRELRPDCPADLAALVERMLAKDPMQRWPSLDDTIAAIGAVPLSYDDPTRSQMIALAKTGSHSIASMMRTPRSPIPVMRRPTPMPTAPQPPAGGGSSALAVAGVAGTVVIAAAIYFAPWRDREPAVAVKADTILVPVPAVATSEAGGSPPADRPAAATGLRARTVVEASPTAAAAPVGPAAAPAAPREVPSAVVQLEVAEAPTEAMTGASAFGVASAVAAPSVDREAVTRVLSRYADALAGGDVGQALQLFPGMDVEERARLTAFSGAGGRMKLRWRIIALDAVKGGAVARVVGTNTQIPETGETESRTIDALVRLELKKGTWRIGAFPQ